jgi:hypothetical protein
VSGGVTNESPLAVFRKMKTVSIQRAHRNHDIILDGDVSNPFVLNDYYQTKLDDFTNGTICFLLRNLFDCIPFHLKLGTFNLTYNDWKFQFIVAGDDTVKLTNVLNYPNPFVSYTELVHSITNLLNR